MRSLREAGLEPEGSGQADTPVDMDPEGFPAEEEAGAAADRGCSGEAARGAARKSRALGTGCEKALEGGRFRAKNGVGRDRCIQSSGECV